QTKCINYVSEISQVAWRITETDAYTSMRKLVDSIDEQNILLKLLNEHNPPIPPHCHKFHPLLISPFRFPPLPFGSRFGSQVEKSLWYGATEIKTCLAEKAFYQFHFVRAS